MSAATNSPTEPINPDPPRDAPAMLTPLGRVLNVVRRLLSIGQQLIASVHQRAAAPDFWLFAKPFGTTDLALIIARITGGLRRAVALEAMLSQRVQRGEDLTPPPSRTPATPTPRAETERAPPAPQPETGPSPRRTRASPTSPPKRKSPPKSVAARSAPSSSASARISASPPASSTRPSGTNSASPSSAAAAASPPTSAG